MREVMEFLSAALPWLCMGAMIAILLARSVEKEKCDTGETDREKENYGTEGMALGMCFGVTLGTALGHDTGLVMSLGMLIGFAIGASIEKKKDDGGE